MTDDKKAIKVENRTRFPDDIDDALLILTEYKSVKNLRFTKQLKDFMTHSQQMGYKMVIRFDRSKHPHISSVLKDMHRYGFIELRAML